MGDTKQRILGALEKLTESQLDVLANLAEDIADGEVNPDQVATKDSARIALARFEAATADMTVEDAVSELDAGQWWVCVRGGDDGPFDSVLTSKTWTHKGLRFLVARERFLESVTCDAGRDAWKE